MNELFHIIRREYLTRVRTRSFIFMTLLTPLFLSILFLLPAYFTKHHEDYKNMTIGFVDNTGSLKDAFLDIGFKVKSLENKTIKEIKDLSLSGKMDGIIYVVNSDSTGAEIQYYSSRQPSVFLLNQIKSSVQKVVLKNKLAVYGIEDADKMINSVKQSIEIENIKVDSKTGQTVGSQFQRPLCMALGVMIYLFIFMFSSKVMRGVLEEKSNRIVELIITSVSPVKFMAGKIIGIALLGLTQIVCWLVILYGFSLFLSDFSNISSSGGAMGNFVSQRISQEDISQILNNLNQIDFHIIVPLFVFFFIGGYLLYSSLFAALSAAANHSDELQQVTMVVTLPLILSVFVLTNTVNSPDSSLSYWFSMIPFTSPIIMTGRIVYGAPVLDIVLSMLFLTLTVVIIIWLSGKIYKTAILYKSKKVKLTDIVFWIKNVNQ